MRRWMLAILVLVAMMLFVPAGEAHQHHHKHHHHHKAHKTSIGITEEYVTSPAEQAVLDNLPTVCLRSENGECVEEEYVVSEDDEHTLEAIHRKEEDG